jgi:hypothetical protein
VVEAVVIFTAGGGVVEVPLPAALIAVGWRAVDDMLK